MSTTTKSWREIVDEAEKDEQGSLATYLREKDHPVVYYFPGNPKRDKGGDSALYGG